MRAKDEGVIWIVLCTLLAVGVLVFTPFGGIVMDILEAVFRWFTSVF